MIQDQLVVELSGKLLENRIGFPGQKYPIAITIKNSLSADTSSPNTLDSKIHVPCVRIRGPLREVSRVSDEDYLPCLHSVYNSQSESAGGHNTSEVHLCPLHMTNSSVGNIKPRTVILNRQLNKPILLVTFYTRSIGNSTFETVLSFPQAGQFEIDVTLANNTIDGSSLKVDIFQPGFRKKSCGESTTSRISESWVHSSPSQASFKESSSEDDLICRIGCRGRAKGQFTNPQDICNTLSGNILATDSNNQCIQVFNVNRGNNDLKFTGLGRLPIQRGRLIGCLQRPTGIAALPENDQYLVADYENRWISIFEAKGKFVSRFGMGKLLGPKGVAATTTGKIYVVDNKASSICVFQTNGRFVGRFGSRGVGEDHLAGPHFIGINSFGHAVVSDFHNHAVKVFDSTGQFLYSFGCNGEDDGQFNAPTGIAVDPYDNILVADWGNSRVQVFDRQGTFLHSINSSSDPLYGPQGLSLSADGSLIYVADSGNHCIKVYKYENCVTNVIQVD